MSRYLKDEPAWLVRVLFATDNPKLPVVNEIVMVAIPIEQVDLIAGTRGVEHAVLGEMVCGSFPTERRSSQFIFVLLVVALFLVRDEEDDLIVVPRSDRTTSRA
jgi:hypothetical protein